MFHTLGAIKNAVAGDSGDTEPAERLAAEVRIAAAADRIVASNLIERANLAWHLGADPARVAVIPCGVDVELFRPRPAAPARARLGLDAEPVLLFVGRLTPIKGLETLLRALAVLRSDGLASARLTLLVVGGTKGDEATAPTCGGSRRSSASRRGSTSAGPSRRTSSPTTTRRRISA